MTEQNRSTETPTTQQHPPGRRRLAVVVTQRSFLPALFSIFLFLDQATVVLAGLRPADFIHGIQQGAWHRLKNPLLKNYYSPLPDQSRAWVPWQAAETKHSNGERFWKKEPAREKIRKKNVKDGVKGLFSFESSPDIPWPVMVWDALPSGFKDAKTWARVLGSCARFGLAFYLARTAWKVAAEVMDELKQEISTMEGSGLSNDHVAKAIQFLELPPAEAKAELKRCALSSSSNNYFPTLQLAQKLALAGLRLRPTSDESIHTLVSDGGGVSKPSVQSVLLSLSRAEASILQQCLWTPSPDVRRLGKTFGWNDIVGLDRVKSGLMSSLRSTTETNPSKAYESLFDHSSSYSGVLLYGPPGCGKSFLIKMLSTQSRLPCLTVTRSVLLRKYVGETNQQCRALFSLAQKLAPCILCIDEVDSLFRERNDSEHEVSRDLKAEFLQYLDGMMDAPSLDERGRQRRNLVVAATNRPFDVDPAILRRLTQSHFVDMPDVSSRAVILRHLLRSVPKDKKLDIMLLAARTEGYSPSDLKHLLQEAAASGPLLESATNPPPLTTEHILQAMNMVPPTHLSARYRGALAKFVQSQIPGKQVNHHQAGVLSAMNTDGSDSKWDTDFSNFYYLCSLQIDWEIIGKLFELGRMMSDVEVEFDGDDDDSDDELIDHDSDDL